MTNVGKGDRIRASWLVTEPASLAGQQNKVAAREIQVSGTIRHFRGDHPTHPTIIRIYLDPDPGYHGPTVRPQECRCKAEHVEVNPAHVKEVLP